MQVCNRDNRVCDAREVGIWFLNFSPKIRKDSLRIDRAKLAGMVGCQAIFRFLEPHRIKRGIGLVKTGDQTFH